MVPLRTIFTLYQIDRSFEVPGRISRWLPWLQSESDGKWECSLLPVRHAVFYFFLTVQSGATRRLCYGLIMLTVTVLLFYFGLITAG